MTTRFMPGQVRKGESDDQPEPREVVIEHHDGRLEVLEDCDRTMGVTVHEASRQAFPERQAVAQYMLSMDGNFAELDGTIDYYDDELPDPSYAPEFVFGAAVAACEAAERGELGDTEEVKAHARLQFVAAVGGVVFVIAALVGGLMLRGGGLSFGGG